jgi:hypothetical protein
MGMYWNFLEKCQLPISSSDNHQHGLKLQNLEKERARKNRDYKSELVLRFLRTVVTYWDSVLFGKFFANNHGHVYLFENQQKNYSVCHF